MKRSYLIILVIVFVVGFFLRFYALGEVPNGMYQDETAIGYNAYSILKTGRDEYGVTFPLYFKSFGDYKLPIYIYSTVISVALFGLTNFAVRFPSALFGFLTLLIFFPFMRLITRSNRVSLVATTLLAITPWHLHYNRATFEVSISLFLYIFGTYILLRGIREKRHMLFVIGTLLFITNIYTYNLTRLLSPFLYFFILLIERETLKHYSKKVLGVTIAISGLAVLPFLVTFFSAGGIGSASGTLIWSSASIQAQLLEFRSFLVTFPALLQKSFFNLPLLTLWQYLINIASYFSVSFFFISGSSHGNHGIGTAGQFYLFEFPLFLYGFFTSLRRREEGTLFFLVAGAVNIAIAALTRESPHATRSFLLMPSFLFFMALGLTRLLMDLRAIKQQIVRNFVMLTVSFLFLFNVLYYFAAYYMRFPIEYAPMWRSEDRELSVYINANTSKYDKIVIDSQSSFEYTSLLYFTSYSPRAFQQTERRLPDDSEGFSKVASFGKFVFKKVDWKKDLLKPRTLIVTSKDTMPGGLHVLKKFSYPQRPVVLSVGQKIMQFPVTDVAYVVTSTE